MNIPQIKDIRKAYEIYQTRVGLSRADIEELFGVGRTYAGRLKAMAKEYEKSKGLPEYSVTTVRTEEAFEAWGLDIKRIRRRARELEKKCTKG
jgi:hypothetical protein